MRGTYLTQARGAALIFFRTLYDNLQRVRRKATVARVSCIAAVLSLFVALAAWQYPPEKANPRDVPAVAENVPGGTPPSAPVSGRRTSPDHQPPSSPTNVRVTEQSCKKASLAWSESSDEGSG